MKKSLFILLFICLYSSQFVIGQHQKTSMRGLNTLHVGALPFPTIAIDANINTYAYIGKIERELASIGALVTTEDKSNGSVILDLDLSPVSQAGYAYMIRIRFMKKIGLRVKNKEPKDLMWVTLWERKGIGYTSKIKADQEIMIHFGLILQEFLADYSEANN
jgi:hypothetical protein